MKKTVKKFYFKKDKYKYSLSKLLKKHKETFDETFGNSDITIELKKTNPDHAKPLLIPKIHEQMCKKKLKE